jgi:hypothetical protein
VIRSLGVARPALFGSVVRDQTGPDGDVDLGFRLGWLGEVAPDFPTLYDAPLEMKCYL